MADSPPELPDVAVVVRGGVMPSRSLRSNAEYAHHAQSMWALSVWSYPEMTAEQVACEARKVAEDALLHGQMRASTAGKIRAAGYSLVATNEPGHYSLVVPDEPDEAVWEHLRSIFGEAQPNPVARK